MTKLGQQQRTFCKYQRGIWKNRLYLTTLLTRTKNTREIEINLTLLTSSDCCMYSQI